MKIQFLSRLVRRMVAFVILCTFVSTSVVSPSYAQAMPWMPEPGTLVGLTPAFTPAHLKGMVIHPKEPLKFDFIVHRGQEQMDPAAAQAEYSQLIKYFLAALAVPDVQQWVNLSPYEKDRITSDTFGKTEMGRDLLAQDYLLKQITASLTEPDSDLGKAFWAKIYAQAQARFGTTDVPVDILNKVWIMPDKAEIYEKDNAMYVVSSHLKLMTETDYLALQNRGDAVVGAHQLNETQKISLEVLREVVLPVLEKEVNEGKNFAPLRQVYSGMLLATWYKRTLKESVLGKVYADQAKVKGVDQDPATNEKIWKQYVAAFQKGVFNMIKEDVDRLSGEILPRKYFSGGAESWDKAEISTVKSLGAIALSALLSLSVQMANASDQMVEAVNQGETAMAEGAERKELPTAPVRDMRWAKADPYKEPERKQEIYTSDATGDSSQLSGLRDKELPRIIEMEIIRNYIMKNSARFEEFARAQNNAYADFHKQPRNTNPMSPKEIYRSMAAVFATLEGLAWIAEKSGRTIRDVANDVIKGSVTRDNLDFLGTARTIHATWASTQFDNDFSTGRFQRPIMMPAQELSDEALEDDFVQMRAAAKTIYDTITEVVKTEMFNGATEALQARVDDLVNLIRSKTILTIEQEDRIRKTALTVFYAHRKQTRKDGSPYGFHQPGVTSLVYRLFGRLRPFAQRPATFAVGSLLHDSREDQTEFFTQFTNFARNTIRVDKTGDVKKKLQSFSAVLLVVRLLSKLTVEDGYTGTDDELYQKYLEIMVDPQKYHPPFPGSEEAYYDDDFIQAVQIIKLCDILYNTGDLKSLFDIIPPGETGEEMIKAVEIVTKNFHKSLDIAFPVLLMGSKHLTADNVSVFLGEYEKTLGGYAALTGEQYAPLAKLAGEALVKVAAFREQYAQRPQTEADKVKAEREGRVLANPRTATLGELAAKIAKQVAADSPKFWASNAKELSDAYEDSVNGLIRGMIEEEGLKNFLTFEDVRQHLNFVPVASTQTFQQDERRPYEIGFVQGNEQSHWQAVARRGLRNVMAIEAANDIGLGLLVADPLASWPVPYYVSFVNRWYVSAKRTEYLIKAVVELGLPGERFVPVIKNGEYIGVKHPFFGWASNYKSRMGQVVDRLQAASETQYVETVAKRMQEIEAREIAANKEKPDAAQADVQTVIRNLRSIEAPIYNAMVVFRSPGTPAELKLIATDLDALGDSTDADALRTYLSTSIERVYQYMMSGHPGLVGTDLNLVMGSRYYLEQALASLDADAAQGEPAQRVLDQVRALTGEVRLHTGESVEANALFKVLSGMYRAMTVADEQEGARYLTALEELWQKMDFMKNNPGQTYAGERRLQWAAEAFRLMGIDPNSAEDQKIVAAAMVDLRTFQAEFGKSPFVSPLNGVAVDFAQFDAAQFKKGGIDLNSESLDLQIRRDGQGMVLPLDQQNLQNIRIDGLVPVILDIRPAGILPLFSEAQTADGGASV